MNAACAADDPEITGLAADSRAVAPGFLFAALPGSRVDGRRFIPDAIGRGARAVLAPTGTSVAGNRVALVTSGDPRAALARLAAAFSGRQPATVAAVTGTNGKTSVAHFTRRIWSMLGFEAAAIGTLGLTSDGACENAPGLTTPDPVALHGALAGLAGKGIDHAVIEASSHGLDQRRLDGVRLRAAAFTNLTRDHLDYHGTLPAYLAAKLRLFSELLPEDGVAVANADGQEFEAVAAAAKGRVVSYGRNGRDLRLAAATPSADGQILSLRAFDRDATLDLPLAGRFQALNALCAIGLAVACGAEPGDALGCAERLSGAPGRMQRVGRLPRGGAVYVDYAHTPDALENVLLALRPHAAGRLIVVFGCGGDRDRGKRPAMGRIASALADLVIVTDDNPRSEAPAAIRAAILSAAPDATEIGDRAEAIAKGVDRTGDGDVLVVAGKGHESGQTVGDAILPFDDAEVARNAIVRAGGTPE